MTVQISVVVCTYNRCGFLQRFLDSVSNLSVSEDISWELIIVDNNSSDETRAVVTGRQDRLTNLRYMFERRQGKGYALNTGIECANGNTIIFTDDDVTLCNDWLSEYNKVFEQQPQYDWFGGAVRPQWRHGEPQWLSGSPKRDYFKGYFVWYEIAPSSRPYQPQDTLPYGASVAIRKHVFNTVGNFREDIGPRGKIRAAGEDIEMIERACNDGFRGYFVHSAICFHHLDEKRLSLKSFFIFGIGRGIGHYIIEPTIQNGSFLRAVSQLVRGIVQLMKGNRDNFRITLINAGIETGRLIARFSK